MNQSKEALQDMLARADLNKQIAEIELQKIDVQFSIDQRNAQDDARDDADTIANKITILSAQKAISIRNKNKDIAQVNANVTALTAAIASLNP